jgi:2-(1,2-epoxy-1,2-dihydrophenyl)acetyl-CoA isomerase
VGFGLIKRALDAAEDNDLASQLELERQLQCEAGSTADYKEAVRAFLGKRKPTFTGKR